MNKKAISDDWKVDQADADNWLRIPEFEVNPQDVAFEGFAFPIVTPNTKGYWLRCIIREHVKTIRTLIRREGRSLSAVRASHIEFLDLMESAPESEKIDADRNQAMSTLYMLAMYSAERANNSSFGKNWHGTAPQTLEICLKEIANSAELARWLTLLSLKTHTELIDVESFREAVTKEIRSGIGKSGVNAKLAADPKQKDKAQVRECWDDWQKKPDRYDGKAAFARDMLTKYENLKSQPVIEGWCRVW